MSASGDKLVSLAEAAALVRDGAAITAGGFAHSHQPLAFTRELIRQGRRGLVLIGVAECWVAEWLAAAGCLSRSYMSNFMVEGFGRCRAFSRAVEAGTVALEDHSHFGMISRLMAAGLGLPFMPLRSMSGTDILQREGFEPAAAKWSRLASPFGNGDAIAVSPLQPDVAVLHVARADRLGNAQLAGPTSVLEEQAAAARRVVITAEEIVETDVLRRAPAATLVAGLMVDAVVHAPYGAHPTGVFGYYDHDAPALRDYYAASGDAAALQGWLDRFVFGPADHLAYLDLFGVSRLSRLTVDPALGWRQEPGHD
ncbi:MAG: hypothetical protein M0Z28_00920 [Rhodospirillales bacterium]|nr:hypothetical protein [Rhodospirillales bacterium]